VSLSARDRSPVSFPGSPSKVRVLVVEDAPEFLDLVAGSLRDEGFAVETAECGERAIELARAIEPGVIVLDLGLPGIDGVEVCRRIRTFSDAYIVMLTGKDAEVDKLIGLSVGADDYMTKPFSPRELVARVRAILRRPHTGHDATAERRIGPLSIDPSARIVTLEGREVELTRIEFNLLDLLSSRPKMVFTREKLLEQVWGSDWFGDDHVVDVHLSSLRRKIGDDPKSPRYISTVRGVGYRFADPERG
jgi:DNA-binding response OmpR family regulator